MARYRYDQAMEIEGPRRALLEIAKGYATDRIELYDAMSGVEKLLIQHYEQQYRNTLDGLIEAMDAIREYGSKGELEEIKSLHALDDAQFVALTDKLMDRFEAAGEYGYRQALINLIDLYDAKAQPYDDVVYDLLMAGVKKLQSESFQEGHGVWWRPEIDQKLAEVLKIDTSVPPDRRTLERLLSLQTADGDSIPGRQYQQPHKAMRDGKEVSVDIAAFTDIVWSPPKAFTLAKLKASPEERPLFHLAQRQAVVTVMDKLEERLGWVWHGKGRQGGRESANLAWVAFDHHTSRRGDPQEHTHVALLGVVQGKQTGKIGAPYMRMLHNHVTSLRVVYQRALVANLRTIGVDAWYDGGRIEARIRGIPDEVSEAFSKRNQEIKAKALEYAPNLAELQPHQQQRVTRGASQATRPGENTYQADPAEWQQRLDATGWKPPENFISPTLVKQFYYARDQDGRVVHMRAAGEGYVPPHEPSKDFGGQSYTAPGEQRQAPPKPIGDPQALDKAGIVHIHASAERKGSYDVHVKPRTRKAEYLHDFFVDPKVLAAAGVVHARILNSGIDKNIGKLKSWMATVEKQQALQQHVQRQVQTNQLNQAAQSLRQRPEFSHWVFGDPNDRHTQARLRQAQKDFGAWAKNHRWAAEKYGFEGYVSYVRDKFAEEGRGSRPINRGRKR